MTERCPCRCHDGASVVPEPWPDVRDPIAALTACTRCRVWHIAPPTVPERPPSRGDDVVWPLDLD